MGKKKKYKVYKKGGESFKPHMMYNTKTGESYLANTYDEHARMDAMGYGHEPMMRMGGMPCYECGGGVHYEFGGSSTAPQNINTGDIGRTNIDLMKNHLAENTIKNILQQRDELVGQMTEQMYRYGGNPRLQYNPNRAFGAMAAQNYYDEKNKAMESGENFLNSIQDFAQNYQTPRPYQPPMEKVKSKKADLSGAYAYGGDLPMAQSGKNINPNIPVPSKEQRQRMLGLNYDIIPTADQKNAFLRKKYRRENPNMPFFGEMEGSKDPSTGYWDRVGNEWSKPWGSGGKEESGMYMDPRATQALKDLVPFVGRDMGAFEYVQNAALLPQKGINQLLTGYFEVPSTTLERYHGDIGGWGPVVDVASDPFITGSYLKEGAQKALPFLGKGVEKAYRYAKPYVKKAVTEAVKLAKNIPEASKKAFIYAVDRGEDLHKLYKKNPTIKAFVDELVSKGPQAMMHITGEDPSQEAYKKELMREEILRELGQPQQAAASSTAVAPRGPIPTVNPNQNQFSNLSNQELDAIIKRGYKYGGDLPKAQYGPPGNNQLDNYNYYNEGLSDPTSFTANQKDFRYKPGMSVYDNRNAVAAQNELEKRKIEEGFYNLGNPFYSTEPSVPKYTDRYNTVTGEGYNVDEEGTGKVTGSSAKAGAKAGAEAKETGKSKTTPSTAAQVAIQQAIKAGREAGEEADQVRKGNTDEASEGPAGTDTKTDNTKTGTVRT
ncbi:MAG: hypothetical protein ACW964_19240, partial [Candidatus Hodarchaeales archaeon]